MNIEVCKKCKYRPYKIYFKDKLISCIPKFRKRSLYDSLLKINIIDYNNIPESMIKKQSFFVKKINKKFLERIDLGTVCPYCLEHQLNDWNNKNES